MSRGHWPYFPRCSVPNWCQIREGQEAARAVVLWLVGRGESVTPSLPNNYCIRVRPLPRWHTSGAPKNVP
jgi:hypothetical protein